MMVLSVAVLACIAAVCVWAGRGPRHRELLREVYSPKFEAVPPTASLAETIAELRWDLSTHAGQSFFARLLPDQGGVLWISILVMLAVAVEFSRPRTGRNVDLVLMLLLGLTFYDMMRFFRIRLDPAYWRLLDLVFTTIFAINSALLV